MKPKFSWTGNVVGYTITLEESRLLHQVLTQEPRTELQDKALKVFFGGDINY